MGVSLWVRCLAPGSSGIAWVLLEEYRLLDWVAPVPYPTGDSTLERKRAVRRAAKIFIDIYIYMTSLPAGQMLTEGRA